MLFGHPQAIARSIGGGPPSTTLPRQQFEDCCLRRTLVRRALGGGAVPTLPRFGRVVAEPHFGDYTPAMAIFPRRNRSRGVRSGMQETCRRVCQDACDRRSIADVCRSQSSSVLGLQLQVDRAPRWPGVSSSLKRPCLFSGSHACNCTVCSLVDRLVFGAARWCATAPLPRQDCVSMEIFLPGLCNLSMPIPHWLHFGSCFFRAPSLYAICLYEFPSTSFCGSHAALWSFAASTCFCDFDWQLLYPRFEKFGPLCCVHWPALCAYRGPFTVEVPLSGHRT